MIGNDRLYLAVIALATAEGNLKARVCLAASIISALSENEFSSKPELWERISKLKKELTIKGPQIINGNQIRGACEFTAANRRNSTYRKFAEEIVGIWMETL